jgi:tetratricopeptide (TPR) repeat protein
VGALEACRAAGYGQTIVVRGEAGMGKTRLVEEFRRRAEAAGFRPVIAHVVDFGAAVGSDPIRQLARVLLSLDADASIETRRAAIASALEEGIADSEMESFLHDLLNLAQPPALQPVYDAMSPAARAAGRARAVAKLCRRLARRQPLLVVVEDAHWADAAMLAALARLARRMAECPGLLVITSRLEGDPFDRAWRAEARDAALLLVDLPPLRREEAASLASALVAETGALLENCIARAEGNPLFLVQLLKSAATASADLPGTVQSLAQARMDRLEPAARAVLQAAAAIGQRFPIDLLRALDAAADRHCVTLVEELFLRREGDGYMFAHALIRDGIYASLLRPQRRAIHAPIAAWYAGRDPALQAEHLERAEDPAAAAAYLAAAEARAAALQPEEALTLVQRGGAIATTDGDRRALALKEGELLHDLGQGREALAACRLAAELARSDEERVRALVGIAAAHRLLSESVEALAVLDEAEPLATRLGDDILLGQIHHLRGNLNFALGRAEACRTAHERALAVAQQRGDAVLESRALSGLGDADYAVGRWHAAADAFRRCVALAERHGRLRIAEPNRLMLGHCLIYAAEFRESERLMRQAMHAIRPLRDSYADLFADESLGFVLVLAGRAEAARPYIERGLAVAERVGAKRYAAILLSEQAEIEWLTGNRAAARALCRKASGLIDEASFGFVGPALLAYSAVVSDDAAERNRLLAEGEARLDGALAHNLSWYYRAALEVRLAERDWETLDRLCDRFLAFRPEGEPPPFHRLLVARARAFMRAAADPLAGAAQIEAIRAEMAQCGMAMTAPLDFPGV